MRDMMMVEFLDTTKCQVMNIADAYQANMHRLHMRACDTRGREGENAAGLMPP